MRKSCLARGLPARRCERSDYATSLHPSAPCRYLSKTARRLYSEGYVTGFQPTEHAPQTIKRFSETEPGKQETVSRYYRLAWDRTAPTLRAGTGSDRGSYQAARPIHPEEPRVITVREAARLQGFPDWFMFHPTKWHSHRMIGNSVSPHIRGSDHARNRIKARHERESARKDL